MDVFLTYMGDDARGLPPNDVPEAWLMTLRGEQREIVLTEWKLRKQGFGDRDDAPAPAKNKGGRPKKSISDIDPASEEIPASDSLSMPGEE